MKKNIVIIGSSLSGNKGAAAMLESAIQTLGEKECDFTLLSVVPGEDKVLNNNGSLEILKASPLYLGLIINPLAVIYKLLPPLRRAIRHNKQIKAISQADVFLDQGGITFVDGREKFLVYNVASILPALVLGKKVVKCAQALGPFKSPINRLAAKIFLPKIELIVARGSVTRKYLDGLKLSNVIDGADYAFLLEVTKEERTSAKQYYDTGFFKDKKTIGISPSVVMNNKIKKAGGDYVDVLAKVCRKYLKKGYRIVVLPHSVRLNGKEHNNDLPLCSRLFEKIDDNKNCLFVEKELSSQELRAVIGECDFFIASRFHAMVSSLAMQVPTLVIGWSHKYKEVLEMFELEQWAFGQENLTVDYLDNQIKSLIKHEKEVRNKLASNLPEVKKLAMIQVDCINNITDNTDSY